MLTESDTLLVADVLPARYERACAFTNNDDRERCIGAGVLLLRLGLRSEADIVYGPYGKPSVDYLPAFNISHSGDYVVCAWDDAPVGVDVECVRRDNAKVAERVFTEGELEWMRSGNADERFCTLWTCKEAVMKLFGEGLHMDPRGFEVLALARGESIEINGAMICAHIEMRDEYMLCVASAKG